MVDFLRNWIFFGLSTLGMLLLGIYVAARLIFNLPLDIFSKACLTVILLLFSQSMTFMRVMVFRSPHGVHHFLRAGGYVSALFMTILSFTVIRDLALLALDFLSRLVDFSAAAKLFALFRSAEFGAAVLIGAVLFAAVTMWLSVRAPEIREHEIPVKNLPAALEGMRIVHLTDLHLGASFDAKWLEGVVTRANAVEPDLICITGDLTDSPSSKGGALAEPVRMLRAPLGVHCCVGNHEYYYGMRAWVRKWRHWGLSVLINEHVELEKNGQKIILAGITDLCATRFSGLTAPAPEKALVVRAGKVEENIKTAEDTSSTNAAPFIIMLAHQPQIAPRISRLGVNLQLSGHTHGGQYFFLFPIVSLLCHGFRSGCYRVGDMTLYVCPGTGLWGYVPMRVGSPAEIAVLTLVRDKE